MQQTKDTPMQKLHFSTIVNAPKKKVWETMFQDATYREWTNAFNPQGSCAWAGSPTASSHSHR